MAKPKIEIPIVGVDKISSSVKGIQKNLGVFGKTQQRVMSRASKATSGLRAGIANLAKAYLGIQGIRIVARGITQVINLNREFEKTLDGVTAKFGGLGKIGEEAFGGLKATAMEVGRSTEFSAQQAAEGLEFLAMAGFTAEQSMAALPQVVDLATAAGVDLSRATDIASDTLGAFGLTSKDAAEQAGYLARVNDVMASTVTSANTGMEDLFASFVKAGPQATSLGQSIETVSAVTGKLANAGLKGGDAGTALRNVMLRLSAPTGEAAKSLAALGINAFDTQGNFRDIIQIMGDFEKQTASLTEEQKAQHLATIFGARTVGAVNVLLKEGSDSLAEYRTQLEGSGGAAGDMAAQMRDNLDGSIKGMQSRLQSIVLGSGSAFTETLKGIIDNMIVWIDEMGGAEVIGAALSTALSTVANVFMTVGKAIHTVWNILQPFAPLILALTAGFVAYKVAVAAATIGQIALNVAMTANPIGLIIAGVAAGIGAVIIIVKQLTKHWDKVEKAGSAAFEGIKRVVFTVVHVIMLTFGNMVRGILKLISTIGGALGFDTTGIDKAIAGLDELREKTREASIIGGIEQAADERDRRDALISDESLRPGGPQNLDNLDSARISQILAQQDAAKTSSNVSIDINNPIGADIRARQSGAPLTVRTQRSAQPVIPR